jgi:hypothetical protein
MVPCGFKPCGYGDVVGEEPAEAFVRVEVFVPESHAMRHQLESFSVVFQGFEDVWRERIGVAVDGA